MAFTLSAPSPWNLSLSSLFSKFFTKYDTGLIPKSKHFLMYFVFPVVSWSVVFGFNRATKLKKNHLVWRTTDALIFNKLPVYTWI